MPKLYFRYGTMSSSKSANLLMVAHNYRKQNKKIILLKPALDHRDGVNYISSRTGMKEKVYMTIDNQTDLLRELSSIIENYSCVLVDEAQFLTTEQVDKLRQLSFTVPVICYGLRTNYLTQLFEGSKRLLELADSIEEIKTTCFMCNKKAIFNAKYKIVGDKPMIIKHGTGEPEIGGDELYYPMCASCWYV